MIAIEHVSKRFGGLRAVDDCSFEVRAGTITGLIGPNGAGKTTLFNIVTGFLKADAGRILLEGRNVTGLPPHRLAERALRTPLDGVAAGTPDEGSRQHDLNAEQGIVPSPAARGKG